MNSRNAGRGGKMRSPSWNTKRLSKEKHCEHLEETRLIDELGWARSARSMEDIVRAVRRKVVATCDHSMPRPGARAYQGLHVLVERPVACPASKMPYSAVEIYPLKGWFSAGRGRKKSKISSEAKHKEKPNLVLERLDRWSRERPMGSRLHGHMVDENGFSENQFGFRKGRSTLDTIQAVVDITTKGRRRTGNRKGFCALISIDIRNAFNTARWKICIESMAWVKVPDYLLRIMWRPSRVAGGSTRLERHVRRLPAHGPACWNEHYRLRGWRTSAKTCRSRLPKPSNVGPPWLGSCPTLADQGKLREGWWRAW